MTSQVFRYHFSKHGKKNRWPASHSGTRRWFNEWKKFTRPAASPTMVLFTNRLQV